MQAKEALEKPREEKVPKERGVIAVSRSSSKTSCAHSWDFLDRTGSRMCDTGVRDVWYLISPLTGIHLA